jgi:hypothetical protein
VPYYKLPGCQTHLKRLRLYRTAMWDLLEIHWTRRAENSTFSFQTCPILISDYISGRRDPIWRILWMQLIGPESVKPSRFFFFRRITSMNIYFLLVGPSHSHLWWNCPFKWETIAGETRICDFNSAMQRDPSCGDLRVLLRRLYMDWGNNFDVRRLGVHQDLGPAPFSTQTRNKVMLSFSDWFCWLIQREHMAPEFIAEESSECLSSCYFDKMKIQIIGKIFEKHVYVLHRRAQQSLN